MGQPGSPGGRKELDPSCRRTSWKQGREQVTGKTTTLKENTRASTQKMCVVSREQEQSTQFALVRMRNRVEGKEDHGLDGENHCSGSYGSPP